MNHGRITAPETVRGTMNLHGRCINIGYEKVYITVAVPSSCSKMSDLEKLE